MKRFREFCLLWHRYVGLAMAAFLIVVGITGSIKVFDKELDHWSAPDLYVEPRPGVPTLDLATLAERAQGDVPPGGHVTGVQIEPERAMATVFPPLPNLSAGAGGRAARVAMAGFRPFYVYLDPWTGQRLGKRDSMVPFTDGLAGAHQFISSLHDSLALSGAGLVPGLVGRSVLGMVALLWTIDCFFATWLTFPVALQQFWQRWKPSWLIKRGASAYRTNLDVHRASGLWAWPLLLVFAWSSVMLNFGPLHRAISRTVLSYPSAQEEAQRRDRMRAESGESPLTMREALAVGQRLAAAEAEKRGMAIERTCGVLIVPGGSGGAFLNLRSSRDLAAPALCGTQMQYSAVTGEVYSFTTPMVASGGAPSGLVVNAWLLQLHYARNFGPVYRGLVFVLGLLLAGMSGTGVYLWWKKRGVRRSRQLTTPSYLADA